MSKCFFIDLYGSGPVMLIDNDDNVLHDFTAGQGSR